MTRLALLLDGTWNEPDDRTNVSRLRDLTIDDGSEQLVRYIEGVGTSWKERIRGGALGKGLSRNLRHGYEWLADNYQDGDHVFLFGFSRGGVGPQAQGHSGRHERRRVRLATSCSRPGAGWEQDIKRRVIVADKVRQAVVVVHGGMEEPKPNDWLRSAVGAAGE